MKHYKIVMKDIDPALKTEVDEWLDANCDCRNDKGKKVKRNSKKAHSEHATCVLSSNKAGERNVPPHNLTILFVEQKNAHAFVDYMKSTVRRVELEEVN